MKREINKIKNNEFDVLVIGGGIHGAAIAYEFAKTGLKICLIEKDDFGSQTSANSLKILHGGLRYLQHANFKRMRESVYSRKVFQQIAPHLIKSIPFVIPTSGFTVKSKLALSIAMKLNDLISFDRNKDIDIECIVPRGKTISKQEIKNIIPNIGDTNITGGAIWYESIALNTERLLFEFLHSSFENGATIANYLKATKFNFEGNKISSVNVTNKLNNEDFNIKAKYVVNAVGPWLNEILSMTNDLKFLDSPLTKAVNIILKRNIFKKYAVGIESIKKFEDKAAIIKKGKRLFFFVPLDNYTMVGTTYKIYNSEVDNCKISEHDVREILNEVNSAYKGLDLTIADVTQTHVGVQAAPNVEFKNEFDVQPETHSLVFNHEVNGTIKNLISVKSVKYTTAPSVARQVVNIIKNKINISNNNSNQNIIDNYSKVKSEFFENKLYNERLLERLWNTYGVRSNYVIERIEQDDIFKKIVFEKEEIYLGEILYNKEYEMAVKPEDFISRRLGLDALENVSDDYYNKIESIIT